MSTESITNNISVSSNDLTLNRDLARRKQLQDMMKAYYPFDRKSKKRMDDFGTLAPEHYQGLPGITKTEQDKLKAVFNKKRPLFFGSLMKDVDIMLDVVVDHFKYSKEPIAFGVGYHTSGSDDFLLDRVVVSVDQKGELKLTVHTLEMK